MTRVLSELLEAAEPMFQQSLHQLEAMAGHPKTDIRLTTEIQQSMRAKIHELGLDGHDTTGHELYAALGERLKADEDRFRARLGIEHDDEIIPKVALGLTGVINPKVCFAIKSTAAKKLLRAQVPRKTMKALGYRSADSMFKHESAASLFAAAVLVETNAWHKRLLNGLSKLKAVDFELRDITIDHPASARWQALAEGIVAQKRQHVLCFKELGVVVILPLPAGEQPQLAALTTSVLVLHAVNEIRVASSYLRLHQMDTGFGGIVHRMLVEQPTFNAEALGRPVSWEILHQFFSRLQHIIQANFFEPLLEKEEMTWATIEHTLSQIEPTLEFWHHTAHIGMYDRDGHSTSCNLTDMLLSHTNKLPFEQRVTHYFIQALRSEILLRYLSDDKPRQSLLQNIQMKLAPEMAEV
jgi:hypothetical protein